MKQNRSFVGLKLSITVSTNRKARRLMMAYLLPGILRESLDVNCGNNRAFLQATLGKTSS